MYGFTGGMPRAAAGEVYKVWAPVIGYNQETRLRKMRNSLTPARYVLCYRFPRAIPGAWINLVAERHSLCLTTGPWKVVTSFTRTNRIRSTFLKELCGLDDRYHLALESYRSSIKTVVYAHSSKLLFTGCTFCSIRDRHMAVPHVEPTGYAVSGEFSSADADGDIFDIWLAGEAYGPF